MAIVEIDYENADRDITSAITVLTDTPSATEPMMCMGLIKLGDGAKDLDGSGGLFEFDILIDGNTVQPSGQQIQFSGATQTSVWTEAFPVPAGAEVILRVTSPNAADSDVDVSAYLYSARLGPLCPTDCTDCCYQLRVWIYYMAGECPVKFACTNYNGINWILTQDGAAGLDCTWTYTDPDEGFTIVVHCELGYWWLTIEHDGNTCARWRVAVADNEDCPPVAWTNWVYVDGNCTGNQWARTTCLTYERPIFPPEWYPEILMNVMRMRLKWA